MPGTTKVQATNERPTPPSGMTAQTETKAIQSARAAGERGKILIGLAFANVDVYEFFRDYGCSSIEEYVEVVLEGEPPYSTLRELRAVAEVWDPDTAAELTCHKLFHFLTYARRKGIEDLTSPGEAVIEVPDGEEIVNKSLRDCTAAEVERALSLLTRPRTELPPGFGDQARSLQQDLATYLGADSFVRVNVERRGRGAVIQIDNLQFSEAQRLRDLLARI